jgi:tetratricopeptide (TPR) repeat protein
MDRASESTIAEVFALQRAARLPEAEAACRAALAAAPRSAPLHATLGRVLAAGGRLPEARAALQRALSLDPDDRLALLEDANLARREGDPARGERNLRRLVALHPREARFGATLAQYLLGLGRPAEAQAEAARALALEPSLADARMALADAEHAGGRFDLALGHWRALEASLPGHPRVLLGIARSADRLRDRALAARCYDALLAREPNMPEALRGRIRLRLEDEDRAGAIGDARRLLSVQPDAVDAWYAIALAHWQEHDLAPAMAALHEVLRRDPGHLPARWAVAHLPPDSLHADDAAMLAYVSRYRDAVAAFEALGDPPPQAHAAVAGAATLCNNFFVHYAIEDALPLQRSAGALLSRLVRAVEGVPPPPSRPPRQRPRVAFVSSFLYAHSVGKLFERVLTGLDRSRIEIQVVAVGTARDALTDRVAAAADGFSRLRRDQAGLRTHLRDLAPDVLAWLDVGMDPMLGWLAAQRLAPVQCALWGHPVTTGLDAIDWFLTADAMEREGGESDYSERVFRLPGLGCRFAPPAEAPPPRPAGAHPPVFGLPQTIFKLTPVHDAVLARIAAALPTCRFALAPGASAGVRERLRARLERGFHAAGVDPTDRIEVQPPLLREAWFDLLSRLDANLDPIGWSGGVTSFEMLWFGIPTVTLPGRSMRSRHTYGMLRVLELDHRLAARDLDHYVRIAVDLGRSADLRAELRGLIAERKHRLYDDPAVSAALTGFLLDVAAGRDPRPTAG